MSTLSTKLLVLAFASVAVASQACTLASPTEVQMVPATQDSDATEGKKKDGASSSSSGGSSSASSKSTCSAKFIQPDLASLTACGNDKGHCYAKDKMPEAMQKIFAPDSCAGGEVCVDDEYIKAGGKKMTSCTGIGGPGVCVTYELNAPMVATPESVALKNAESDCAEGLVCIPCVDIRTDTDTGMCGEMGLMDAACSGGGGDAAPKTETKPAAPVAECCGGKGQCMVADKLPNGAGDNMEQDTCPAANVCAPKSLVQLKATTCTTMLMKGICVGACFNSMLAKASEFGLLRQGDCAEEESCVPCTAVKKFMAGDGTPVPGCE